MEEILTERDKNLLRYYHSRSPEEQRDFRHTVYCMAMLPEETLALCERKIRGEIDSETVSAEIARLYATLPAEEGLA